MPELWPPSLQALLNSAGFKIGDKTSLIRTSMDAGPSKVRSRYTSLIEEMNGTIWVDLTQKAELQHFYRTTLQNGTRQFYLVDPTTGEQRVWRFLNPPSFSPLGGGIEFNATLALETVPGAL